ncbi:hypothetical protein ACROYT_G040952 [Oculina patagonica]
MLTTMCMNTSRFLSNCHGAAYPSCLICLTALFPTVMCPLLSARDCHLVMVERLDSLDDPESYARTAPVMATHARLEKNARW